MITKRGLWMIYLNYENKKDLYIDNFLEVVDFKYANKLFED